MERMMLPPFHVADCQALSPFVDVPVGNTILSPDCPILLDLANRCWTHPPVFGILETETIG